jgi:hypothetical protein
VNLIICDSNRYVIVSVALCTYRPLAPELIVQYDYGFLITVYTCRSSYSFFLSSTILIKSGGRYNLWSYTLCSFLHYPITFGHKILRTAQHSPQPGHIYFMVLYPRCDYKIHNKNKKCSLSMYNFTVVIINDSYMFQLHSSHHQAVYVRSIKGNHILSVHIKLKLVSGR